MTFGLVIMAFGSNLACDRNLAFNLNSAVGLFTAFGHHMAFGLFSVSLSALAALQLIIFVLIGSSTLVDCWIIDLIGHSDLSGVGGFGDLSLVSLIGFDGLIDFGFISCNGLVGRIG